MAFLVREIVKNKRDKLVNTNEEIAFLIDAYVKEEIPDYQMSAWLMAVYFNGLNPNEAAQLVKSMLYSGKTLDFSNLNRVKVDKHSTGGVGDKTSMIIAPLVACTGLYVPMMAGRGLGHSGGTIDKLESIPGFRTSIALDEFQKIISEVGTCIIGQSTEICPADRKIYALRDVTATVESIPLICASIMSKKIAEGIDALTLDVKWGNGAFMKSFDRARELAVALSAVGKAYGKKVIASITDMNQPTGLKIGNSLEIEECMEILKDPSCHKKYFDTVELSLHLSENMLLAAGHSKTREEARAELSKHLHSGAAYEKFQQICKIQSGDLSKLPKAKYKKEVYLQSSGYISEIQTEHIGLAGIMLGAGRKQLTDKIDYTAGFELHYKLGSKYDSKTPVLSMFADSQDKFAETENKLLQCFKVSDSAVTLNPLVKEDIYSY